jgi:soluble lytic murein transglycosylase-like protein
MCALPASAAADYGHVVKRGETLTSVAAVDGLSIAAIAQANGISPQAELVAGQTLQIPPRRVENAAVSTAAPKVAHSTATGTAATTTESDSTETSTDPDADGDTDASTATDAPAQTKASAATRAPAQTKASAVTRTPAQTKVASYTRPATSSRALQGTPQPTQQLVSSGDFVQIAAQNGVPASLAEAIAWQESGWNNDEVSSIGAVGVMQIVPSTWTWIDRYLTPSAPLGTTSAAENIRGGVLLLHELLAVTGDDYAMAIAGYYQGLASVKAHGMYPDTRQYVNDVLALQQRFGG